MIRGLYTAASGMMANIIRQMATTNNLANVSTPGYKEDSPVSTGFPALSISDPAYSSRFPEVPWLPSIGDLGTGVAISGVETNLSPGPLKQTGNSLDFALDGQAFFTVQTEDGTTCYTRNGAWGRDAMGRLVTADGYLVLGERGPILLPDGSVTATEDGTIVVDGQVVDRLRLADFPDGTTLHKMGNCLFAPVDPGVQPIAPQGATVYQGFLEGSNVDEVRAMVEMMAALRSYEAEQRALSIQNQTLGLAVNELGQV